MIISEKRLIEFGITVLILFASCFIIELVKQEKEPSAPQQELLDTSKVNIL